MNEMKKCMQLFSRILVGALIPFSTTCNSSMASETTATQTSKSQNFNLLDKDSYEVKTSLGNFISLGRDFYRDRINQNIRLTSNNLTCVSNQYGCWDHLNNEYVRVFINESKLVSYFKSRGFLSKSPQIRQISLLSTFTTVLVVAAAAATIVLLPETGPVVLSGTSKVVAKVIVGLGAAAGDAKW